MAENTEGMDLTIGLKVDVSQFKKEWESTYRKQVQDVIGSKPVSLKVDMSGIASNIKEVGAEVRKSAAIKANDIIPADVFNRYNSLVAKLKELRGDMTALQALIGETKNTSKKMAIYSELKDVNAEAESVMRQIQSLDATISSLRKSSSGLNINGDIRQEGIQKRMTEYYKEQERAAAAAAQAQAKDAKEQERAAAAAARESEKAAKLAEKKNAQRAKEVAIQERINAKERENNRILNSEVKTLDEMKRKMQLLTMQRNMLPAGSPQFVRTQQQIEELDKTIRKYNVSQRQAASSVNEYNAALRTQRGLLNGMPQFLNAYISVLGGIRLVDNIRKITAEFELQRVALAAIIQDKEAADQLFKQTVAQAIESPFTAKELITYTKQLSAYRIESDKLFETTKMLADVSAGLGVSLDRLILAYGQVRAASVLRGTEVRQFTEAGIPLIEELADKYTELEGRVVSTSEVFDRISRRKVPFEDVADIFKEMTSAGGMFYDMQKKQSETLYGVYQKLGDQLQISFSQIGEENMGALRGAGELALYVAKNLNGIVTALTNIGIAWGTYALAQKAYLALTGSTVKNILSTVKNEKLRVASALQLKGALQQLTVEEQARIASARKLTVEDVRAIASNKAYTSAVGARLIATKKISQAIAMEAAAELQLSKAEITRLATMKKITAAWKLMAAGIKSVIASMKSLAMAAITNPFTWIFAVLSIISKFISKHKELKESIADVTKQYDDQRVKVALIANEYDKLSNSIDKAKEAQDGFNETDIYKKKFAQLKKLADAYESLVGKKNIVNLLDITPENIDSEFNKLEERYQAAIKYTELLGYATAEMGNKLTKHVAAAGEAYSDFTKTLGDSEANLTKIGIILQDNYENLSDYEKGLVDSFMQSRKEGQTELDYLNQRLSVLKRLRYVSKEGKTGQQTSIWGVGSKNKKLFGDMAGFVDDAVDAMDDLNEASKRARETIYNTIYAFKEANKGIDFSNLAPEQAEALEIAVRTNFSMEDWNDYARELAQNAARLDLGINVTFTPINIDEALTGWRKDFYNVLKDDIQQDTTFQSAKKALVSAYQDEKEVYTDLVNAEKAGHPINQQGIEDSEKRLEAIKNLAQMYGILLESTKSTTGGGITPEQRILGEIDTLKEAYKQYQKMQEVMGDTAAFNAVDEAFQELFSDFKYLKGAVTPKNLSEISSYLQKAIDSGVLTDKTKVKLRAEISENTVTDIVNSMKDALAKAKEQVQRSKEANTFYEGLLSSGLGEPIAWQMTMDLYGANPMDIRKQMENNLKEAFKEKLQLDLPLSLSEAEKMVRDNTDKIGSETSSMLLSLISDLRNYDAETIKSLQSNLSKTSELEAKRVKIYRDAATQIAKLQALPIDEAQKETMRKNIEQNQKEQLASLKWEEFKSGDLYTTLFSDLDKVSKASLEQLRSKLALLKEQLKDLPADQLKDIMSAISKVDKELLKRDPFSAIVDNIGSLVGGYKRLRKAEEEYIQAQSVVDEYQTQYNNKISERIALELQLQAARQSGADVTDVTKQLADKDAEIASLKEQLETYKNIANEKQTTANEQRKSISDLSDGLKDYQQNISNIGDAFNEVKNIVDTLGIDLENTTLGALFDGVDAGLKTMQSVVSVMQIIITLQEVINTTNPIGWVTIALGAIAGAMTAIFNAKSNALQKQIEALEDKVHSLERAYERLEKAAEKALGSSLIQVTQEQQKNLKEQAEAYRKMYDLERQKGKKRDDDKLRDYKEQYEDTLSEIQELQEELVNTLLGSDLTSAARDFANSWIEAYASFSSTTDAMKEKFSDMVKNLIVESMAAKIVQGMLKPIYDSINKATEDSVITESEISDITSLIPTITDAINSSLGSLMESLKQQGIDIREGESNLTGISAAAAGITEDTALTLGAIGNNMVYYLVSIHDMLAARFAMDGVTTDNTTPTLLSVQQAALTELKAIQNNTYRNAIAAEQLASALSSVISPIGVKSGSKAINVNL